MDDCTRYDCKNNPKCCFKCYDHGFYDPPKIKQRQGNSSRNKSVDLNANDSWKGLESEVAKDLSNIPDYYTSERQIMSGALWFAQGDIKDPIGHFECKERQGNVSEAKGTRSFTIDLGWIEKGEVEAEAINRPFFLPFRYKGNPIIRVVTQWKWIVELIVTLKSYMIENEKKDVIIRSLQKQLKEK